MRRFQHEGLPAAALWQVGTKDAKFHEVFVVFLLVLLVGCANRNLGESKDILQLNYPVELGVVSRGQWGWSKTPDGSGHRRLVEQAGERTLPSHDINRITIHHGGEDFPSDKDPVKYLQTFQFWCRNEKKWIDIPYHFMIDLKGTIYEARPINLPGDTNTDYDVRGHALICVMGNYENQILSERQLRSLIDLTAFLANRYDVPVDSIKGHKDYTETLCPGKDLYKYLQDGTIVKGVKEKLHHQ